jgi:uncharacterized membrane protein YkvA (DUF1232 family)
MLDAIKAWARTLRRDAHAIYLAARSPDTPWYVKALALIVAGYALSPIDLIPDFIPVVGYLDDLILVPLGIRLVVSLIPADAMAGFRAEAEKAAQRPRSRVAAAIIVAVWIFGAVMLGWQVLARRQSG